MSTTTTSGMRLKITRKWKLFANLAIDSANPSELLKPFHWRTPSLTEIDGDLFHPGVPFKFVDKVMAVIALNPHITFQVLTKRPERMARYFDCHFDPDAPTRKELINELVDGTNDALFPLIPKSVCDELERIEFQSVRWPLPNLWIGTSVENREALHRLDDLRNIPAAVRFVSNEPALGDLGQVNLEGISWWITGGESGPNARPMHPDWARSLRDQCVAAEVPFFFKQWGEWMPETCVPPRPEVRSIKVGKARAGRLLDGREWNEFPEVSNG